MTDQTEFSRPLKVDRVPRQGCTEAISADPAECAALAQRFGLIAIHSLTARVDAQLVSGHGLKLVAHIRAAIEQTCIVSLDNFTSELAADAQRVYLPEGSRGAGDGDEADTFSGDSVDLGEFVAEELGLALDPYPRKPGVAFQGDADTRAAASSPFAELARLKSRRR